MNFSSIFTFNLWLELSNFFQTSGKEGSGDSSKKPSGGGQPHQGNKGPGNTDRHAQAPADEANAKRQQGMSQQTTSRSDGAKTGENTKQPKDELAEDFKEKNKIK